MPPSRSEIAEQVAAKFGLKEGSTPGPWKHGDKGDCGTWHPNTIFADDESVAQAYGIPLHVRLEEIDVERYGEGLANAALIAAAPVLRDALISASVELEELRARQEQKAEIANGQYWRWQGDGDDHLESLTCPILIGANQLRDLLRARQNGWISVETLRRAAEESWEIKNGLMEIRDSAELCPSKEEWISAKLSQWAAPGADAAKETSQFGHCDDSKSSHIKTADCTNWRPDGKCDRCDNRVTLPAELCEECRGYGDVRGADAEVRERK